LQPVTAKGKNEKLNTICFDSSFPEAYSGIHLSNGIFADKRFSGFSPENLTRVLNGPKLCISSHPMLQEESYLDSLSEDLQQVSFTKCVRLPNKTSY
jgi:hypothetical protein